MGSFSVEYSNSIVAIIDGCRYSGIECDKTALRFLCDDRGLVDYKSFVDYCKVCSGKARNQVGINAHGYFCASIVAARKIKGACLGRIRLGTISGIVPPPRIAIYAIGCPCGYISVRSVHDGIQEAILQKVDVISMSLAKELPSRFCDKLDDGWGIASLDAFRADVLVVQAAGNYGKHGLSSIQRTPPWCLTVGSCTPKTKFKSRIELVTNTSFGELKEIEGYSISMFPSSRSDDYLRVRKKGDIRDAQCIMYLKGKEFVIEPSSDIEERASPVPIIIISKETSKTLSYYLDSVAARNGSLYAFVHSSSREEVDGAPYVSYFSGRGPCCFYNDIVKPDLCAPGEHVPAFWPDDEPIGDIGNSYFVSYNVLSGTSFATPLVAAGLATIKAENKFSVSATISAAITTGEILLVYTDDERNATKAIIKRAERNLLPRIITHKQNIILVESWSTYTSFQPILPCSSICPSIPNIQAKSFFSSS